MLKNLLETSIIKQNQPLKTIIIFEWTVVLNTWKSNNFCELHENEPEMTVPGVEMNNIHYFFPSGHGNESYNLIGS